MGKVSFPLINSRKDVIGAWHPQNYHTIETAEKVIVASSANEYGYYTAFLNEIPESSSDSSRQVIVTYDNVPLTPTTDPEEVTQVSGADKYYVNYSTGEILFNSSKASATVYVQYYGRGSLVEAEDINYVQTEVVRIDGIVSGLQIEPELNSISLTTGTDTKLFKISNTKFIRESGLSISRTISTDPNYLNFAWSIKMQNQFDADSLKLSYYDTSTQQYVVIADHTQLIAKTTTEYQWALSSLTADINTNMQFKLSATYESATKTFEHIFYLTFVSGIFYGNVQAKIVDATTLSSYLNNSSVYSPTTDFELTDESGIIHTILGKDTSVEAKFIVFPYLNTTPRFYDNNTNLSIALDEPIPVYISRTFNSTGSVTSYTCSDSGEQSATNKLYHIYNFTYNVHNTIAVREEF